MEDIPMPNVLDPERPRLEASIETAGSDAEKLRLTAAQFEKACAYGRALWGELDRVRRQLAAMLPDPEADDDARRYLTAPRGPDDDEGWATWQSLYAGVTSSLAGPRGDSGFGRHEAAREAQHRRGVLHAGPDLAELGRQAAETVAQVEHARSDGYVVEPGELDRETAPPAREPAPAASPAAVTSRPAVLAAVAAVTGVVGYLAGRRRRPVG